MQACSIYNHLRFDVGGDSVDNFRRPRVHSAERLQKATIAEGEVANEPPWPTDSRRVSPPSDALTKSSDAAPMRLVRSKPRPPFGAMLSTFSSFDRLCVGLRRANRRRDEWPTPALTVSDERSSGSNRLMEPERYKRHTTDGPTDRPTRSTGLYDRLAE
jgi:hypothetical protein